MTNQNPKKTKKSRGLLVVLFIIVILAVLVICFKDRIFISDTEAEGSLLVTGQGKNLYYVYDVKDNKKVGFTSTGQTMSLPAGKYKVALHDTGPEIRIKSNDVTVLQTGVLLVQGDGVNLYEVWDKDKETKLNFTRTGKGLELFPGTYTVILNNISQKITVAAEDTTRITTGRLLVSGKSEALYYVFDQTGNQQLNFTSVGEETELFPGKYIVKVENDKKEVEIEAGKINEVSF